MDLVEFEPEFNPEAIMNYYSCGVQVGRTKTHKDLILKSKKHLSAIGWSFFYIRKNPGGRELRYRSPAGKTFNSLRSACQYLIRHQDLHLGCEKETKLENDHDRDLDLGSNSCCSEIEIVNEKKMKGNRPRKRVRIQDGEVSYFNRKRERESDSDLGILEDEKNEGFLGDRPGKRIKLLMGYSGKKRNEFKPRKHVRKVADSSTLRKCVLSLLIERKIVLQGSKVSYRSRKDGRVMAEGRAYEEGIRCNCCDEFFLLSKFEAHAGSTFRRPAANIFLEDGRSLLDCQAGLTRETEPKSTNLSRDREADEDDFCSFCIDGGELLLCDSCTSSFHSSCIGLNGIPDSDYWFCPSCCCHICFRDQISSLFTNEDQIKCKQCEHNFHTNCLKKKGVLVTSDVVNWLCSDKCERIFFGLMGFSGKSIQSNMNNNNKLSWSLLKLNHNDKNNTNLRSETYGKLKVALNVMHECFKPILKHPRSDGDLIKDIIFSRCSKRSNFNGFFTAVLERDEEMITAVAVRVHGCKAAEIPLVATRFRYQKMGMCRILMAEIERMLEDLGVEKIVLPAIPEMVRTWTESFGFKVMDEIERLKLVDCKFVDFPGSIKCQKILKKM